MEKLIDLKQVYVAREKNGVYIPKDRYYKEEIERKIEQMGITLETHQKEKYDVRVQQSSDLRCQLEASEYNLEKSLKIMHLVEEMCVLEKYFPSSFFVITIHLVVHLVDISLTYGPVRYR